MIISQESTEGSDIPLSTRFWLFTAFIVIAAVLSLIVVLGQLTCFKRQASDKPIAKRTVAQEIYAIARIVLAAAQVGVLIAVHLLVVQQTETVAVLSFWIYVALLSIANLWQSTEIHLNILYVCHFVPSLMYDIEPLLVLHHNISLDKLTSLRIASATITLCLITIWFLTPRTFVPIREKYSRAAPEQTASLLSLATFSFLDKLTIYAWRNKGIKTIDEVYDLPDFQHAEIQTDNFKYDNLLYALLNKFRLYYAVGVVLAILATIAGFLSPYFLNRLLDYLQTLESRYSPYVYCAGLLFGPVLASVFSLLATFCEIRISVGSRAILNHLLYSKILSIRQVSTDDGDRSGRLNNLVSVDAENVTDAIELLGMIVGLPIKLGLSVYALWYLLGWAPLLGYATMLITMPIPAYLSTRVNERQRQVSAAVDSRISLISEALQSIRITKFFAWEEPMMERIHNARTKELSAIRSKNYLMLGLHAGSSLTPVIVLIFTFIAYTLAGNILTASIAFTSLTLMSTLQNALGSISWAFGSMVRARVSYYRIRDFLRDDEIDNTEPQGDVISFEKASYQWNADSDSFALKDLNLHFPTGKLSIVAGPVGSGKTSLLMAILGEMQRVQGYSTTVSDIAYVSQTAWLQNATIRENILFGNAFDDSRYRSVLHQCALEVDLKVFPRGDQIQVGEKGVTLSGGQKQRIALARALYSDTKVLLLDDVFSAVDSHTARWIFGECLCGNLVKGRTVVLVTHYVKLCSPAASLLILMDNGRIVECGPANDLEKLADVVVDKSSVVSEVEVESKVVDSSADTDAEEAVKSGSVGWSTYGLYLSALGGTLFWILYFIEQVALHSTNFGVNAWVSYWVSSLERNPEDDSLFYLGIYIALSLFGIILEMVTWAVLFHAALNASKTLHARLLIRVFRAPISWFDRVPIGRILNRFSTDIDALDSDIITSFAAAWECLVMTLAVAILVSVITPAFIIPAAIVTVIFLCIGQLFITCSLSLRRLVSTHRSPIYSLVGDSINGVVTIRAFRKQQQFVRENWRRLDAFNRVSTYQSELGQWLSVRTDITGGLVTMLAGILALMAGAGPGLAGLSLSYALGFTDNLIWSIRMANGLQLSLNSVERIQEYLQLEQEPGNNKDGEPPAAWPTDGDVDVQNLTVRYGDGPVVLDDISFSIKPREKIGVVGRTGSGKSTLAMAILRCVGSIGMIRINGRDISHVNLDILRKRVTLIPQDPVLFSGTIRSNLDPFEEHDDAAMWSALKSCQLLEDAHADVPRLNLDSKVAQNGSNFSQGERQLICLARALIRRSKLIIMDEATSSTDDKTDALIQQTIRESSTDMTLITIAHRLKTVADFDRVIVLQDGKVVEFDSPRTLLNTDGLFRKMCEQSGELQDILALAG